MVNFCTLTVICASVMFYIQFQASENTYFTFLWYYLHGHLHLFVSYHHWFLIMLQLLEYIFHIAFIDFNIGRNNGMLALLDGILARLDRLDGSRVEIGKIILVFRWFSTAIMILNQSFVTRTYFTITLLIFVLIFLCI
jgi:hypothetical protein